MTEPISAPFANETEKLLALCGYKRTGVVGDVWVYSGEVRDPVCPFCGAGVEISISVVAGKPFPVARIAHDAPACPEFAKAAES